MCWRRMRTQSEWKVQMVGRVRLFAIVRFRAGVGMQFRDALLHFARGFVGEGDGEDVSGRDAALDHVRDAEGDDARLARARAGEDQHRAWIVSTARRCCGLSELRFNIGARSL